MLEQATPSSRGFSRGRAHRSSRSIPSRAQSRALEAAGLSARVACVQGAAEALPFADGSFRAAMLLDVIEHLRNPVRSLREIRRVLRPGAPLLVATPAWRFGHRNDPVYHLDEYREDELARQLHACGFTIAQTARIKGVYDDIVMIARA
jgi:SAM-dependent methyltransferase